LLKYDFKGWLDLRNLFLKNEYEEINEKQKESSVTNQSRKR